MTHGIWFFIALLFSTSVTSLQTVNDTTADDYEHEYYDDDSEIKDFYEDGAYTTVNSELLNEVQTENYKDVPKVVNIETDAEERTTEKKIANYEVTELVIDVPDVSTKRTPFFNNFTIAKPLNFAGVARNKTDNASNNAKDEGDEILNSIFVPDKPKVTTNKPGIVVKDKPRGFGDINDKKNYFNHFHPSGNFDFEEDNDDEDEANGFDLEDEFEPKDFKDYFHNIGKGIVTSFKTLINKHKGHISDSLHKIADEPISFLTKLHKKKSDVFKNYHNTGPRHKCDDANNDHNDSEDDYEYEY